MNKSFRQFVSTLAINKMFVCSVLLALVSVFFVSPQCHAVKNTKIFTDLRRLKREHGLMPMKRVNPLLLRGFGVPASYSKSFMPVKNMQYYGHGETKIYLYRNIPRHHIENARQMYKDGIDYFKGLGQVYVYDFNAVTPDGKSMQLRVAFDSGCGDTNDGFWGEVWNKQTRIKVADIYSTADTFSTIVARTKKPDMFDSAKIPILDRMKFGWSSTKNMDKAVDNYMDKQSFYSTRPPVMQCSGNRNLAKIVALSLKIFCARYHAASPKRR